MIKIVVTGPESTGKSTLAQALAAHYRTLWVPEYARYYLQHLHRPYAPEDVVRIAQGQIAWETVWEKQAQHLLICDTALLVPKIWMEHKYGYCDPWIDTQWQQRPYDFYLLCDIDLPWQDDPLREHPQEREALFAKYRAALDTLQRPYAVVSGAAETRLAAAVLALEAFWRKKLAADP